MKKTKLLLLLTFCIFSAFGQQKAPIPKRYNFSITDFYHKNMVFRDTVMFDMEYTDMPKTNALKDTASIRRFINRMSFADAFVKPNQYTIDSIPETATINVNGIYFTNKNVLAKIKDYEILKIKKDSIYANRYDETKKAYSVSARYQKPHALVYQDHNNLPHDFFFFKQYTLEPVRYRCFSFSPVLDVFNTEDSIVVSNKPRVMIDGRLQAKSFNYQYINLENVQKIESFGNEEAYKYFGTKAKSGLISVTSKDSKFNLEWALANTRIITEIQDRNEKWKVVGDTILTSLEQFKEFRNKAYSANGPIYLINGELETEKINRKTIDLDAIESVRVVSGKRTKRTPFITNNTYNSIVRMSETVSVANDTVFIQTEKESWTSNSHIGISNVMSQLKRIRNTSPDPTPIYIVDNQEIDAEKLKLYKSKELEFVESFEGCDAISRYGKRAEFGVVIYRKKKIE